MNEPLKKSLTHENLNSYANSSIELIYKLIELQDQNFTKIIIPSRGAYPFYRNSLHAFRRMFKNDFFKFYLKFQEILLPFTAEWGGAQINKKSKNVRRY